jgi:hypothetical protein
MQGKARNLLHQQNADAVWQAPFEIVPALHFNPDPLTKRRLRPGNGFSHDLEPFGDCFRYSMDFRAFLGRRGEGNLKLSQGRCRLGSRDEPLQRQSQVREKVAINE